MKIKRVCFFLGHYDPARQVIFNYYEKIFPRDMKFFIACADKFDREKYKLERTKVFEFTDKRYKTPFQLRKFLKENKIELLINLTGAGEIAISMFIATVFTKTKSIFYFLGNPKANLMNSCFLFFQFFFSKIISSGKEISDKLKKILFFNHKKMLYLPFPINTNLFVPKNKKALRKKFGFKKSDKVLFYVGRIEPEQGSDYLLELIKRNPEKKFLLVGQIKDENFEKNKFKNVTHFPFIPNKELPDYINTADLSLFFSKRNSYPYPPRESLACEVPVLLFDLKTFGQLKTRATIKVGFNIEKVQKEIERFFSLPEKELKEISKEGREFIVKDSSEEKLKDKTIKMLFK